jgi:hypothetical protein
MFVSLKSIAEVVLKNSAIVFREREALTIVVGQKF